MYLHNLQTIIPDLKAHQSVVVSRWMQKDYITQFLQNYGISPEYFIEAFAYRLVANVIHIIENDFPIHQYLITKEVVMNFESKNINAHDVFTLYQSLKDVCIELLEEGQILSSGILLNSDRIVIDIYKVFERLTHDILYFYAEEFHSQDYSYVQPA